MIKKSMNIANDRVVSIDYTLTDDKNRFIDASNDSEPLDYLHGHQNIIPGLEKALEGKRRGDHVRVSVPAADAYGERDDKLVTEISRDRFGGVESLSPGMQFQAQMAGEYRVVTVTNVAGDTVTIDGNHPLAGMNLIFDVTIAAVREAGAEELAHGHVHGCNHGGCESGACDHGCRGCG
jgi:FKBP-type peptidyl-prolyl cis-trans isomerase SlyD